MQDVFIFNKSLRVKTSSSMKGLLTVSLECSIKIIMTSRQQVNKDKSHFLVHSNAFNSTKVRITLITGFKQKEVVNRITWWKEKILSYRGRCTLVKHVLQSLPIHLISTISPLSTVIKQIQSLLADFFLGWTNDKRKYHWSSWKNLSFPYEEGGIGMRNLQERSNPISKKWETDESLTWKHLMQNKVRIEKHIHWKINSGTCSFWWDNWLGVGPLANFSNERNRFNNSTVPDFLIEGQWNMEMVLQQASYSMCGSLILIEISLVPPLGMVSGKKETRLIFTPLFGIKTSLLNVPFCCGGFGNDPATCFCCDRPGWDTIEHIFNTGNFSIHIWRYFAVHTGVNIDHIPLIHLIMRWWSTKHNNEAHKCARKYGGKQSNASRVKYAVYKDNYKLMINTFPYIKWSSNWRDLIKQAENCFHDTKVTIVSWQRPPDQWVKLNTNGSTLNNPEE
ncbi:hypothetical protein H5410_031143 [Solanum commersonii]|uniref:Uncharacterized protein n=1 Tax=Solanum commersonii TaxID=4109 RepID=A0A9J5YIA8_SOLCO|nr:hypothetical protein H5410_031143 [Solanum commersonii]